MCRIYLSVREMKEEMGMNGNKTGKIKLIRKGRLRIARRLRHERGKEMEGGKWR